VLILSLDTTTRAGSCALARDGVVVREDALDPSRQVAVQLPGALDALLALADAELHEVNAFAVATGPGSFTGLRVGIATMQGLAFAESTPLIGVSALDALAVMAGGPDEGGPNKARPTGTGVARTLSGPRIATWVDAWRGDVYAAWYVDGRATGEPVVAKPTDLLAEIVGVLHAEGGPDKARPTAAVVFIGDGAVSFRELIVATLGDAARIADPAAPLLAGTIATLATDIHAAGHRPPAHAIRPIYVRRPDAELARSGEPDKARPAAAKPQ
jgi:tRNA threonylcarbamoyladenosine biosynthesis protein TsaB